MNPFARTVLTAMLTLGALVVSPANAIAQGSRFVHGERTVSQFEYTNQTLSDLRSLFGFDTVSARGALRSPLIHDIESTVRGNLVQTVLERRGRGVLVAYSLRNASVRLRVNGEEAASSARKLELDLERQIFAALSTDGRVTGVWLHQSLDELSRSFARTLVSSTQFVVPVTAATPPAWATREDDPAGSFDARYRLARISNGRREYVKVKLRYQPQESPRRKGEPGVTQRVEPSGEVTGLVDGEGRLLALTGTETQRVLVGDRTIARGRTIIRMTQTGRTKESTRQIAVLLDSAHAGEQSMAATRLFAIESADASEAALHSAELRDATAESLLAELSRFESVASDTSSTTALYLRIKALVYLRPESSVLLGHALRTARANSPTMLVLSGALASIGHREAQAALANVIEWRRGDWPALATLIPVLGGVRRPGDGSVDAIFKLAFNATDARIASTARLAAGTMARSIAVESASRAKPIVERLIAALNVATTVASRRELLLVLGNTGSVIALPAISGFARDGDASLRAAAMIALRWIDGRRAESLLMKALAADTDSTVRMAAARALDERGTTRKSR